MWSRGAVFLGGSGKSPAPILLVLIGLMVAWWASSQITSVRYQALVVLGSVALVALVFVRWIWSIYLFMIYVFIEGFLLHFFHTVPELNLLKDLYVIALFVGIAAPLLVRNKSPFPNSPTVLAFLPFAVLYVGQIFNPNLPNILMGLVGARVALLFVLLIPVAYWFFDSRERVVNFFVFLQIVSFPIALFGIFQYFAGPAWLVSLGPGFQRAVFYAVAEDVKGSEFYFRTLSTFVQSGAFSYYLWFMMTMSIALFNIASLRLHRIWIAAAFGLQFIALITTGGRSSFVLFFVTAAFIMVIRRQIMRLIPAIVMVVILFFIAITIGGPAVEGRFRTLLDLDYVQKRQVSLVNWLGASMASDPVGLGAGYATIASRHAGTTPLNVFPVENALARIRFETGIVGFVLYLFFVIVFVWECLRLPQTVKDPSIRWLSAASGAFIFTNLVNLPVGTPFDVSPVNVLLWFLYGFMFKAPLLDAVKETTPHLLHPDRKPAVQLATGQTTLGVRG